MKAPATLCIFALALGACSEGSSSTTANPTPIAEGPLSGQVGGESWTFVGGQTDAFLSEDDANFFAEFYAEPIDTCASSMGSTKHSLILNVPKSPGDYTLSLQLNATFVIQGPTETLDNLVATKGRLVVDEVTSTQIRGGAFVERDAQNSVNGQFTIAICGN